MLWGDHGIGTARDKIGDDGPSGRRKCFEESELDQDPKNNSISGLVWRIDEQPNDIVAATFDIDKTNNSTEVKCYEIVL